MRIHAAVLMAVWAALAPGHAAPPAAKPVIKVGPTVPSIDVIAIYLDRVIDFEEIDDPKATLRDYLTILRTKYAVPVPFRYNAGAFRADADPTKLPEDQTIGKMEGGRMTFKELVRQVLGKVECESGANFLLRHGHIEITTDNAIRRQLRQPIPATKEGERPERLPPLLSYMKFDGETLEAACEEIAEKAGVTVAIDPRVKEKAETKIKARLVNIPLDTAMELVADMAGLAVARKANAYYVTTAENAAKLEPKGR